MKVRVRREMERDDLVAIDMLRQHWEAICGHGGSCFIQSLSATSMSICAASGLIDRLSGGQQTPDSLQP